MENRDLQVIREYFTQLKKDNPVAGKDIETIITLIGKVEGLFFGATPSITLPRASTHQCGVCKKTVVFDD